MEDEGVPSTALREVSLLQMLSKSDFIVRLLSVEHIDEGGKAMLYLVFEYLDTDLKKFMDATGIAMRCTYHRRHGNHFVECDERYERGGLTTSNCMCVCMTTAVMVISMMMTNRQGRKCDAAAKE